MINSKRRRREGNIIHQDIHERVFRRGYKLHLATVKETMLSYFFSFIVVGSLVLFIISVFKNIYVLVVLMLRCCAPSSLKRYVLVVLTLSCCAPSPLCVNRVNNLCE